MSRSHEMEPRNSRVSGNRENIWHNISLRINDTKLRLFNQIQLVRGINKLCFTMQVYMDVDCSEFFIYDELDVSAFVYNREKSAKVMEEPILQSGIF